VKYKTALVVGRFQPFHKGHLHLIKEALKHADKLVIGIGSSNIKNQDNPFSFEERKEMVEEVLQSENLWDKVQLIIPLADVPDDMEWAKCAIRESGEIDVVIGNNDSGVNIFFEKLQYPVIRILYLNRELYQGIKIRPLFVGEEWKDRVPQVLVSLIEKNLKNV